MIRPLLVALALLPALAAAQTASYTYVDQKPPFTNPTPPMLTARTTPALGGTLRLLVPYSWRQRNRVGEDYLLATGLGDPGIPVFALGGWLYTSAEIVQLTPQSPLGIPGTATVTIPIPNDVRLLGFRFYQQVLAATASPRLSRGGAAVVGR